MIIFHFKSRFIPHHLEDLTAIPIFQSNVVRFLWQRRRKHCLSFCYNVHNILNYLIIIIINNKLRIYIAQFPWRDDQLRITTIHGIK